MREGGSVHEHIKELTETFNDLSVLGGNITDEDRVVHLLASLPDSYSVLVTALKANAEVPSMETVTERLLHEERKLSEHQNDKAMAAMRHGAGKRGPRCYKCGESGHLKRDYPEKKNKSDSKTHKSKHKYSSKQKANVTKSKLDDSESDCGLAVFHALGACNVKKRWIIDSGATCHMCNDKTDFTDFVEQDTDVILGDGHHLKAEGSGTITLEVDKSDRKQETCTLKDVLYVPDLSYNLLSVSRATKAGKTVDFSEAGCEIVDGSQRLIATGSREGSLYFLDCSGNDRQQANVAGSVSQEKLWHRRYGHLGMQNLERLVVEDMVVGLRSDMTQDTGVCEPCAEGKHRRSKFPTAGGKRGKEILDLVHSDVCGKMSTGLLSGYEYFLTIIDDKTRYTWIYVLKHKDEVFAQFLEWKALVENSTGRKLKALRTDNGGEYTSKEFETYLKQDGIRHERTVPKTPKRNGVAERMNRTIVETARCMLAEAKLPRKFWAEAVSTAVYLRNRSPMTAVSGMTPFEALTGDKPCVDILRVFGCLAYVHVPKDERRKFDSKSKRCILLGYGSETKAYRLYEKIRGRIIYSRDVIFDESKCGIEEERRVNETPGVLVHESPYSEKEPETKDEEPVIKDDEPVSEDDEPVIEDMPERPVRQRQPPDRYGEWVTLTRTSTEPTSVKEVMKSPNKEKWEDAMKDELKSLQKNDVWELVKLPNDRKTVGSKWVFKEKIGADGSIERYKARLVAQGYSQQRGLDYDETFSPVVRTESVRALIALAAKNNRILHQLDVTTAFLNGTLDEEIYMKQPEGSQIKGNEHLVCKLRKSIYGLKRASRCWDTALHAHLCTIGFCQSDNDPCIYVSEDGMVTLTVYVDNIILGACSEKRMKEVKQAIGQKFITRDMGELEYFLGVAVNQNKKSGAVWIGQPVYTSKVIEKFNMTKNPQYHGRAKHISIKYHFVRERVENGVVILKYCPSENMLADMFTKGLNRDRFCKLREMIGVQECVIT